MTLKTRRWCAPAEPDDGLRVLVSRYRPRAPPIGLSTYRALYLEEMSAQEDAIHALASRLLGGEDVTLLCSKDCFLPEVCHRTALAELVEKAVRDLSARAATPARSTRDHRA